MLTWFSLIWSQFQFLVIIDYVLGKKHIGSMLYALTKPEWESLSNRYGTRTTQHMYGDCRIRQRVFNHSIECTCSAIVSPNMLDLPARDCDLFPDAIFQFLVPWTCRRKLGENWWVSRQFKKLTWFSLIWSQFQFLVIIDYFLGKKHKGSMLYALTQLERELLSNRYGTLTTQHMHDHTTSVQLSYSSPRCTQVSWV